MFGLTLKDTFDWLDVHYGCRRNLVFGQDDLSSNGAAASRAKKEKKNPLSC